MLCSREPFVVSYAAFYRDAKMGKDSGLEVDKNVRETSASVFAFWFLGPSRAACALPPKVSKLFREELLFFVRFLSP